MSVNVIQYSNFDAVAAANASGDAARIAAAANLRILRRDNTMSNRTIGGFDFRSVYVNDGATLGVGKTFRNLVAGGANASVENASGLSYWNNGSGVRAGVRFTGDGGRILLPPAFQLPSTATDFLFVVWLRLHAGLTGSNFRTFAGWSINGGVNGYSFQVRTTSILAVMDASAARTMIATPALETVYQLGMRYQRAAGSGSQPVTEYLYLNGQQIAAATGFSDTALNQPAASAYLGRAASYVNTGMDFTIHRAWLEDMSIANDRPNPNGLDAGLVAIQADWNKYQNRFLT